MLQVGIIVGALAAPHAPRHGYPPVLFMLEGHPIAKSLTVLLQRACHGRSRHLLSQSITIGFY